MNPWYRIRDVMMLVTLFERAIKEGDALTAGAVYGCLYDLFETAKLYSQNEKYKYAWKRVVDYLEEQLDTINEAAKNYPMPIQQALVAKIVLYRQGKHTL